MDRENIVLCARSTSVRESIHDQEKNYSGRLIFISIYVCWNMKKLKWGKHSWLKKKKNKGLLLVNQL